MAAPAGQGGPAPAAPVPPAPPAPPAGPNAQQLVLSRQVEDQLTWYRQGKRGWNSAARNAVYSTNPVPLRQHANGVRGWPGTSYRDFQLPNAWPGGLGVNSIAILQAAQTEAQAGGRPANERATLFPRLRPFATGGMLGPPPTQAIANRWARRMTVTMQGWGQGAHGLDWQFVRILGWGGNGVAALFKRAHPPPRAPSYRVAKCEIVDYGRALSGSIAEERGGMEVSPPPDQTQIWGKKDR